LVQAEGCKPELTACPRSLLIVGAAGGDRPLEALVGGTPRRLAALALCSVNHDRDERPPAAP
jgi:hypothetical protein